MLGAFPRRGASHKCFVICSSLVVSFEYNVVPLLELMMIIITKQFIYSTTKSNVACVLLLLLLLLF